MTVFINRVKEVNPYLNAVVEERYRAAIENARAIDRWIVEAKKSGSFEDLVKEKPLLGVPFTVKESCSLAGKSHNSIVMSRNDIVTPFFPEWVSRGAHYGT